MQEIDKAIEALEEIISFMPLNHTPNSPFAGDRYQDGSDDAFYKSAVLAKKALAGLKAYKERMDSEELLEKVSQTIHECAFGDRDWDSNVLDYVKEACREEAQAVINVIKGE